MVRLQRVSPIGVPQHIIQRGNNRELCFASEENMKAYLHWLKEFSKKYCVEVHAWVLMTNHVHLLYTPQKENAVNVLLPEKQENRRKRAKNEIYFTLTPFVPFVLY